MHSITTEILTLDEFTERRKIGRTTVFERVRIGVYQENIDYICDGNEKKFFWPTIEMIKRDLLVRNMLTEADSGIKSITPSLPPSALFQTEIPITSNINSHPEEIIMTKPSRRDMPRLNRSCVVSGRPAFDI